MGDVLEKYYAEMEAERIASEDAYFKARHPSFDREDNRKMFRAGFERAFSPLWHRLHAMERERNICASVGGSALRELHDKVAGETEAARCICGRGKEFHPWRFCDKYVPSPSE